ncbi:hypothetical protein WJX73_001519 [Symbiochloris irregularis]|uniref:MPN domain-containing protein n=1 Tax=Symbiochloris irregularis TaxID=706552 RepID=A0AAW1PZU1_9CHLO
MPSTEAAYTLQENAALKILLHAAKYPSAAVNGVLLGTVAQSESDLSAVTIVDAVPLFHTFLSLSPMLETALVQVASYAKQQGFGLQVVGYYHANASLLDKDLSPTARKIADKVHQRQPASCTILVDNTKLQEFCHQESEEVLQLWLQDSSGTWKPSSSDLLTVKSEGLSMRYQQLQAQHTYRRLFDFDDHLNDIAKDWSNDGLLNEP